MRKVTLGDLQESVQDKSAFKGLADYYKICKEFLAQISFDARHW